jgi:uncharacterized membrane protein
MKLTTNNDTSTNNIEKNIPDESSTISILNIKEIALVENNKKEVTNIKLDPTRNIIRNFSNFVNDNFNYKALKYTTYYKEIHHTFIFLIAFIGLFNNNIVHLCAILIIVTLDAFSVVVLHGCPLTIMESKYLNESSCDIRNNHLKNLGIMYNCDHDYEKQVELLINVWMLISGKIAVILFLKTFNLKLHNFNNIYVS